MLRVPVTVLHVEDNAIDRIIVREAFSEHPEFRLLSASSASEALALAMHDVPSVMLLDLHLGDATGVDVIARFRRDQALAGVPVVILSADDRNATRAAMHQAGAFGYLTKPLDVDKLLNLVASANEENAA